MDIKAINIAIQNANKITVALADRGLFAEAGVVHSLTQAVRVVHNAYNECNDARRELMTSDGKSRAMLQQVVSDLNYLLGQTDIDHESLNQLVAALRNTVVNFLGVFAPPQQESS